MSFGEVTDLNEYLRTRKDRRSIVKTGAKLAYAAPLVAASLKITSLDARAAVSGPQTCTPTGTGPASQCTADEQCCSKLCRANELFGIICVCRGINFACERDENCCEGVCGVDGFCHAA